MTLDGGEVSAAELGREWGIQPAWILSSYRRHSPDTRVALREAIQRDLATRTPKPKPHGGSLAWGRKGEARHARHGANGVDALRARLEAMGRVIP